MNEKFKSKRVLVSAIFLIGLMLGSVFYAGYSYAASSLVVSPSNIVLYDRDGVGDLNTTGNMMAEGFYWRNGSAIGQQGLSGTNGTNGANGADGVDGDDGSDGVNGADGNSTINSFTYLIGDYGNGTYYCMKGNTSAIVDTDVNSATLTSDILTGVITSGTLYLNQVSFSIALMNSIPANVQVVASVGNQTLSFINPLASQGSPYTIENGQGQTVGYYTAKDAQNRICYTSTNATEIMQDILNEINSDGRGSLYVSSGQYIIDGLFLYSNTHITGSYGSSELIMRSNRSSGGIGILNVGSDIEHEINNVLIENLVLNGNRTYQNYPQAQNGDALHGVEIYKSGRFGGENITVQNCIIHDNTACGVETAFSSGINIRNNVIFNNGHASVWIDQGSKNVTVTQNDCFKDLRFGIMVVEYNIATYGGGNIIITNNKVYNTIGTIGYAGDGIAISSTEHYLVEGNSVVNNNGVGIKVSTGAVYGCISNNIVTDNIASGIQVQASGQLFLTIMGNMVKQTDITNQNTGISVKGQTTAASEVAVISNMVINFGSYGGSADAGIGLGDGGGVVPNNIFVDGNIIENCVVGIKAWGGGNHTIINGYFKNISSFGISLYASNSTIGNNVFRDCATALNINSVACYTFVYNNDLRFCIDDVGDQGTATIWSANVDKDGVFHATDAPDA